MKLAAQTVDYSRLNILLVDDNQHMRTIMTAILTGVGISSNGIKEAREGAEALDLLRHWDADLALIDYNMSPLDGIEFARLLRNASDSSNRYLPLIMVSGHSEMSRVKEARDAGINEFVIKPLTAKSLLSRMVSVVMKPRAYVRCPGYFGPDRRRRNADSYAGPYRRESDGMT